MKRLIALAAAAGALALAACDNAGQTEESPETPPPAEAALPAAEEAAPAVATAPAAPRVDSSTLPAEKRTSEETVRPDSETLFY